MHTVFVVRAERPLVDKVNGSIRGALFVLVPISVQRGPRGKGNGRGRSHAGPRQPLEGTGWPLGRQYSTACLVVNETRQCDRAVDGDTALFMWTIRRCGMIIIIDRRITKVPLFSNCIHPCQGAFRTSYSCGLPDESQQVSLVSAASFGPRHVPTARIKIVFARSPVAVITNTSDCVCKAFRRFFDTLPHQMLSWKKA
mmetsp:Transcript_22641/g.68102  ORF Transcript_22641/g.68102 Transcript_22641/m.68102 type:complete len:198 (+) Transcript_22641:222-815(+)